MDLVFATNNGHKLHEVRALLSECDNVDVVSLKDIGCFDDIEETGTTLDANSLIKAQYVWDKYGKNCFADDTGLEVEALDGRPGVYSARYAGEGCTFRDNVVKLLSEMEGKDNRRACFRTVITLIIDGKVHSFEGRVDGRILEKETGDEGFGYDPVFVPDGYDDSFAEMPLELKNKISHRGKAMMKLVKWIMNYGR